MTVFENVAFGLRVKPRSERPPEAQIKQQGAPSCCKLVQLDWLADRYPLAAVGRPAPAHRAGPRAGGRADGAAARRALRRAGREGAQGTAPLAAPPARRTARHQHLRHARPGRGARSGRPRGGDEQGQRSSRSARRRRSGTTRRAPSSTASWATSTCSMAARSRARFRSKASASTGAASTAACSDSKALAYVRPHDLSMERYAPGGASGIVARPGRHDFAGDRGRTDRAAGTRTGRIESR